MPESQKKRPFDDISEGGMSKEGEDLSGQFVSFFNLGANNVH